jgi:hypothetical protein
MEQWHTTILLFVCLFRCRLHNSYNLVYLVQTLLFRGSPRDSTKLCRNILDACTGVEMPRGAAQETWTDLVGLHLEIKEKSAATSGFIKMSVFGSNGKQRWLMQVDVLKDTNSGGARGSGVGNCPRAPEGGAPKECGSSKGGGATNTTFASGCQKSWRRHWIQTNFRHKFVKIQELLIRRLQWLHLPTDDHSLWHDIEHLANTRLMNTKFLFACSRASVTWWNEFRTFQISSRVVKLNQPNTVQF